MSINTSLYHSWPIDKLNCLSTRHLISLMNAARRTITCSCGPGQHCGDDVLDEDEKDYNRQQRELKSRCKDVLMCRPHIERNTKQRTARNFGGKEKKLMKYRR
jgi:hypothetical protein